MIDTMMGTTLEKGAILNLSSDSTRRPSGFEDQAFECLVPDPYSTSISRQLRTGRASLLPLNYTCRRTQGCMLSLCRLL